MTPHTCDAHFILPHPTDLRALLVPAGDGGRRYALPTVSPEGRHLWQDVAHLNRLARERYRADVTVRRCVHTRVDAVGHGGEGRRVSVYELEIHNPAWQPPADARWVGSADEVPIVSPEQTVWLGDWFKRQARPVPPTRREWYRAGWRDGFLPGVRAKLDQLGIRPAGDFEQVRTWERSALLRVATNEGTVWVKAVPPMFAHEAALADYLAARFPWHAPDVLAVDPGRKWILMREFGRTLDQVPDARVWTEALGAFSRLQVNLADQVGTVRAVGVPDRPVPGLCDQFDELLAERARSPGRMLPAEVRRLIDLAPRLRDASARLADFAVPDSLEHGDFWPGQVVVEGDLWAGDDDDSGRDARGGPARFRFVDWSDSSVTHPFFSFLFFGDVGELAPHFGADAATMAARFEAAYLEPWGRFERPARLREAMRHVRLLAPAHHAVTYARYILPHMEAQWEMRPTVDAYLRRLLDRCDETGT